MQIKRFISCKDFPCLDVNHSCYIIPDIDVKPENISIIMISEASPPNLSDYYYAKENSLFEKTTVQAFKDAGVSVSSIDDILNLGVYLTCAVKCGKNNYGIKANTINECSLILEKELSLFPKVKVIMLMGDVAIKSVNYIAKRMGLNRVIPQGSTYKIRKDKYFFNNIRVFPSYLQAGPSFFIEKSKRKMIAEDIKSAFDVI